MPLNDNCDMEALQAFQDTVEVGNGCGTHRNDIKLTCMSLHVKDFIVYYIRKMKIYENVLASHCLKYIIVDKI